MNTLLGRRAFNLNLVLAHREVVLGGRRGMPGVDKGLRTCALLYYQKLGPKSLDLLFWRVG